jgi:serine/threonine protein kinase
VEISPKKLIDNRYRILRLLGKGGFGRTYLVQDERRFGELCVLKEFAPDRSDNEAVTQKLSQLFQREAKILHQLDHPQIPKFLAWFRDKGRLFIVQEYVNGKTYWQLLQQRKRNGQTFSEAEVIRWLKDLLPVVGYIHDQNIIHRDISPDNVMLPKGKDFPVLIDFGVVKHATTRLTQNSNSSELDGATEASVLVGKYGYAPYEQIYAGLCSSRSDIYALGVSAVVLLTGRKPSKLIHPSTLDWTWQTSLAVDERLVQILSKMTAKEPHDRYSSARAVLADLHQLEIAPRSVTLTTASLPAMSPTTQLQTVGNYTSSASDSHYATPPVGTHMEWALDSSGGAAIHGIPHTALEGTILGRTVTHKVLEGTDANLSNQSDSSNSVIAAEIPGNVGHHRVMAIALRYISQLERPLWKQLALGFAVVSLAAVGFISVQSSRDGSICWISGNCINNQELTTIYQQSIEAASVASSDAASAKTLNELSEARDRLHLAVEQLEAIPSDSAIHSQVAGILPDYRLRLNTLDERIREETNVAGVLQRAQQTAQSALASLEAVGTIQDQDRVRNQLQTILASLQNVPSHSLMADEAQRQVRLYQQKIEELDALIAQGQETGEVMPLRDTALPIPDHHAEAAPAPSVSSRASTPALTPERMPQAAILPRHSQSNTPAVSRPSPSPTTTAGAVPLVAAQTIDGVTIRIDGAHVNTSGTFIANLVIENRSDRTFGFVPVYGAYVESPWGQDITSRVSFGNSSEPVVEPGSRLTGQLFILGQRWKADGDQNLVLIVQEGTTGGRTFQISF